MGSGEKRRLKATQKVSNMGVGMGVSAGEACNWRGSKIGQRICPFTCLVGAREQLHCESRTVRHILRERLRPYSE